LKSLEYDSRKSDRYSLNEIQNINNSPQELFIRR
jgi:hypothetical protein